MRAWTQEVLACSDAQCRALAWPGSRRAARTVSERRATTTLAAVTTVSGSSARRIGSAATMCARHARDLATDRQLLFERGSATCKTAGLTDGQKQRVHQQNPKQLVVIAGAWLELRSKARPPQRLRDSASGGIIACKVSGHNMVAT